MRESREKFLDHYEKNKWECASDHNMTTDEGQIFNIPCGMY